jgi:VCBS repeat-containing protein
MRIKNHRAPLALESRVMFDAAAFALAVDAVQTDVDKVPGGSDAAAVQPVLEETAALAEAFSAAKAGGQQVVFVSDDLPCFEQLITQLPDDMQVVVLDSTRDGLQQIAQALQGQSGVSGIHLVTHGNTGQLLLGDTLLDPTHLNAAQHALLADIGRSLAHGADLLVYGCDFGAGDRGSAAVSALAGALGVDIAASSDATGSQSLGGDWTLEVKLGEVSLEALSAANWEGLLGTQNATTAEDTPIVGTVPVLLGVAQLASAPNHGTVVVTGAGVYTYAPDSNYSGTDSFTVKAYDVLGILTSSTTVNITVTAVNDAPTALGLSPRSGQDGAAVSIATASRFLDVDGDSLSYSASGLPSGLSISSSTGVISGTLASNASAGGLAGVYTVMVTASDGNGGSASQTFALTVSNPGPTAVNDSAATAEDTAASGNVLANDSDDDALTASLTTGPLNGTVTLAANGSYTYTPNANYNGSDSFAYRVTDAQGAFSLATVSITVAAVNDSPVVASPLGTVAQTTGVALSVAAAAGFSDADVATSGQVLTYSATGLPAGVTIDTSTGLVTGTPTASGNYTVTVTATDNLGASVSQNLLLQLTPLNLPPVGLPLAAALAHDGSAFSYNAGSAFSDPNGDALAFSASGLPAGLSINASTGVISGTPSVTASAGGVAGVYTVTVTASDGKGGSASQVLALAVGNPGPNAVADSASGLEDTVITGNVLANDSDDDSLSAALLTPALNGSVSVAANGAYTYTPHANFNGTDSFTYTVTDSQGATAVTTVTVTVAAVNDAPTLSGSALGTVMATVGTPMSVVMATAFADVDVATNGQVLTYSASGLPNGLSINASTGVIVGTTLDVGTHPVNVTVTDAAGASISQTLTLQLSAVHAPPVAVVDTATTHTNTAVNINVLANDVVAMGDTLSVTGANAVHGSVSLNGDGTITYTPNAGFNGVDTIQYTVRDSSGADALLPGLVTVTVSPQNISIQLPTLINLLNEDQPLLVVGLGGNKISVGDINGNLISVTLSVAAGDLTLGSTANLTLADGDGVHDSSLTFSGLATDINAALAGLIYTPGADYNGPVTINVTALDTLLGLPVVTAQLPIGIAPVADVVDDTALLVQDQPVSLNVLANDNFENPSRAVTSFTQGAHGSVTIDADGNAVYTPNPGYYGPDSFTYTVTSNGTTETATVTLTVDARPIAADPLPTRVAIDGQVQNFNVAAAFSDPDGDTLSYSASGLPPGLSLDAATGQITGTLTANASAGGTAGAYAVSITANDGKGGTLTRSFTFTVTNPGPTAVNDSASGAEDTTLTGNVLGNDSDDDSLSASLATGPSHGTVTLNADGSYVYTPTANFNGTDTFTYTVTDAQGATATATVTLTVTPVNDAPTASGTPLAARSAVDSAAVSINTATAFTDADGQALSFSATGLPAGSTIDPVTGAITGTLGSAASAGGTGGVYAITVTANDGSGGTSSQTFNLTVTNPGPTALNDTLSLDKDTTAGGNVLANDSDDDALTVAITTPPANGSVLLAPDGSYSYTPNANFNGSDSFTYTITDAQGATATATVTITVAAVNDGPTGSGSPLANASGQDGQAVSIATAGAFTDPDGPAPTYSALGLPPGLSIDPSTGVISGTLAATASAGGTAGVYNITVMVSDSLGGTASQSFTFTASNPGPVAQADSGSGNEDTAISGNVLVNDSDDDTLSASLASGPSHGSVSFNADGSYTYTPDANYSGTDSFTYTVTDAQGATATATVTLNIAAVNDSPAPSSSPLAAESGQDGSAVSIATAPAFTDPDGPALSYSATGLPPGLSIDAATGLISGTLTSAASAGGTGGVYTVTVTASDGAGGSGSQSFTFTASNPGPMASDDNVSVAEGGSVSAQVLMNDVDDDALTASLASAPAHGTLVFNTDGTYTYTPTPGYNGSDTFTYTATDAQGASATATVTITVVSVNTPPSPSGTPLTNASLIDGQAVSIDAAAAFSDPDGPALSYSATGLPSGLVIDAATGLISGTLPPDASAGGTAGVYTVTVTADDGDGGVSAQTVQFTIGNPGPSAANDTASGGEDTAITGNVLANDSDDDSLTASLASGPAHGSVTLNADGSYSYIASANFNGSDSFTYTVTDAQGATATATVSITVTPINDAPAPSSTPLTAKAANDGQAVAIGTASAFVDAEGQTLSYSATGLPPGLVINPVNGVISGTLAANASAGGTGGVYSVTVTASDGAGGLGSQTFSFTASNPGPTANADSLSVVGGSSASGNVLANDSDDDTLTAALNAPPSNGNVTVSADGSYTYAPNLGFSGTDTFTYTVTDAQGLSTTATVTVTVAAVNDAPVASSTPLAARAAADGDALAFGTASGFTDAEGDTLSYSATGLPPGLAINASTGVISGTLAANASAGGTAGVYSVTVTANDGNGGTLAQTFDFTASNPGPNAADDTLNATSGIASNGNVLANDSDDDTLTAALGTGPANGSLTLNSNGSYSYTPNAGFTGTDTFTYTATDAQGATATATVTIAVSAAPNTAPTASATPLANTSAADGAPILLPISGAFTDGDGDALSYSATGLPPGLAIDPATGVISGTLPADASSAAPGGLFNVTVTADDGNGGTLSQTFTFTATNPGPTAADDTATVVEDGSVTGNVLDNDSDDDTFTATLDTAPTNGSVTLNPDGSYTYTPDADFNGTDTFSYTVTDAQGATAVATVTVTALARNDAPNVVEPTVANVTAIEGQTITLNASLPFRDADGDTLTFSVTGLPPGLSINPTTGVITGRLDPMAASGENEGVYTVTVTAADDKGGSASQRLTLTVTNPAPLVAQLVAATPEDTSLRGNVLAGTSDDDAVAARLITAPTNGSVTLSPDGTYTYTPEGNFNGTDSFSFTVQDSQGASRTATVTITVNAVNDVPTASGTVPSPPNIAVGQALNLSTAEAFVDLDGDRLSFIADGLPPGVTLNATTGIIAGSPSQSGTFTVTVTATDEGGAQASQTIRLTVDPAPTVMALVANSIADTTPISDTAIRSASYDTVLIKAVNDVKRLGGTEALTGSQSLTVSVGGFQNLAASADLNQSSPIAAVVGDLSEGFRTPIRVDADVNGILSRGAGIHEVGMKGALQRLDTQGGSEPLPGPVGQADSPAPETLAGLLAQDQRRQLDELDALARALG